MKKFVSLLILAIVAVAASAQVEHSIILDQSTFRKVNADAITGVNIDPIAKDLSRNACARVKIRFANMSREDVDALEVKFQSNTDLARQYVAQYFDNVLILEMTAKPNTRFYVQSPEYGQSNEISVNLDGDFEYEMEARLNQSFSIVVNTNISGADVYIDGNYKGRTDSSNSCTVKGVIIGTHTLKLVYGDVTAEQQIDVNSGKISFRQDLSVEVERFDVTFKIEPANATITIDNGFELPISNGLFTIKLPKGRHSYVVKADKYHPQSCEFDVADSSKEVAVSLKVDGAMVSLSAPNNADIWINGVMKGKGTWSGLLYSGSYTFEARKDGHRSTILSKEITSDQTAQSYTLSAPVPIVGSLNVTTAPAGATVYIDGQSVGTTPFTCSDILSGQHTIRVTKSGYKEYNQTITITQNATTRINTSLDVAPKYEMGDLVTINGVQGVVFQTSPVVKLVSVKEGKAKWSTECVTTNATDKDNGKANMDRIKSISDWQTKYTAFKWCADYGSGWYLPSLNELMAIYTQQEKINKTLLANKMNILGAKNKYKGLWSSSEYFTYATAYYIGLSRGNYSINSKYATIAVRAVYVLE